MDDFFRNIPEAYHEPLDAAIAAINESKAMLADVQARFGTADPARLRQRMGESCGDAVIGEETVAALEELLAHHEERREACRALLERIAGGRPPAR